VKIIDKHECMEIPKSLRGSIAILNTAGDNKWVLAKQEYSSLYETVFYKVKFCPYCGEKLTEAR